MYDKGGAFFLGYAAGESDYGEDLCCFLTPFILLFLAGLFIKFFWVILFLLVGIPAVWVLVELLMKEPYQEQVMEMEEPKHIEVTLRQPEEQYINQGFFQEQKFSGN